MVPQTAELASPMRSLPTSVGRAPKLAESKKTNTDIDTNPTTITCAAVR